MDDCIFCKIIKGEIPCTKVYEDANFLAFLDIHPVSDGHTLLIPKAHYDWMHNAPDEIISSSFILTKKLMNSLMKGLPCDYVQVSIVGKDVPHFHIHLIPRYYNDAVPMSPTHTYESPEHTQAIADAIKKIPM